MMPLSGWPVVAPNAYDNNIAWLQMSDNNSEIDTIKYVHVVVKMWLVQSMWPKEVYPPLV